MAGSPLALSYPEPFRVTGPLLSIVLRTEDVWQRYKPDSSLGVCFITAGPITMLFVCGGEESGACGGHVY